MSESKHTRGSVFYKNIRIDRLGASVDIFIGETEDILLSTIWGEDKQEAEANAARFIQCWNEYDQLKAENERLKGANLNLKDEVANLHEYILKIEALNRGRIRS